ncbi:hypothetical protein ABIF68_005559 [Bradyrhizobium japonicum]|uniref:hypothetical protein n=1 Tax=Bradyrhizobium TaxID=374 RepID=UPI000576AAB8|nr:MULTISPECIES: hypothetical protein [Bradyrhizobium]MBR0947514.1 hypothetical protein [Bradyrhizobium liaoningense]MDI2075761.1 hypothetical protein [Bradyrhizobium sp. Mp27]
MVDTSKIPETTISPTRASDYRYLRPMSEGGGPIDSDFTKAFEAVVNGAARTAVLQKYGLSEIDFGLLTDGQKNTLKLEMQAEANAVTKDSLYGKEGLQLVDGKLVRRD